jgi:F-type H+-transporting ATPase subunit delta
MAIIKDTLANRYASSLFALAAEKKIIDAVRKELILVSKQMQKTGSTSRFFNNPLIPSAEKQRVIEDVCNKLGLCTHVLNFMRLLVDNGRVQLLSRISFFYNQLADTAQDRTTARVVAAVEIDEAIRVKLAQLLEKKFKKKIVLECDVNPELIGGLKIELNNQVIDYSIKGELERIKEVLTKEG